MISKFNNPWDNESKRSKGSKDDDEIQKIMRRSKEKINQFWQGNNNQQRGKLQKLLLLILLLVPLFAWLSTGFYVVDIDQQGVVTRFGQYDRTSHPGLNYKLPDPIERVEKVSVTRIHKDFIGTRSSSEGPKSNGFFANFQSNDNNKPNKSINVADESQMLTGDENIIDMHFFIQWHVKNPKDYIFNIRDEAGENTVRSCAESAMRQVIGEVKLYDALSEQRQIIAERAKKISQQILDSYQAGVEVVNVGILYSYVPPEVKDAYRDVQSAKADKEREINQAYSYRNDIIPKARGDAQSIITAAKAYKDSIVAEASGDAGKFDSIYEQYVKSKDVTKKRIYIETMEDILSKNKKIIIDERNKNLLQMMSLNDLIKKSE